MSLEVVVEGGGVAGVGAAVGPLDVGVGAVVVVVVVVAAAGS